MDEIAAGIGQEDIRAQLSAENNGWKTEETDRPEEEVGEEQKSTDSRHEPSFPLSNQSPDSQVNGSDREASDIRDRPTSLRLESVLEYTSKIKTFLGLKDESEDSTLNVPPDPNWKRLPRNLVPDETSEGDEISETESSQGEAGKSDNAENKETEDISEINQDLEKEVILESDRNESANADLKTSTALDNDLFPDVVKTTESSPISDPKNDTPDVLKENNINHLPFLENNIVPIATSDVRDLLSVEKEEDTSEICKNVQDLKDLTNREEFLADDTMMSNQERLLDLDPLKDTLDNPVPNASKDGKSENEESCSPLDSFNSSQQNCAFEDDIQAFEKNRVLENPGSSDDGEIVQSKGSQSSGVGESYQVMHIEEGLRKVEKEIKECDQQKDRDVNGTSDSTVPNKESGQKMEDIRRLSSEVVNFVLHSAGEEVKNILRERNSIQENEPSREMNKIVECSSLERLLDAKLENKEAHHGSMEEWNDDSKERSGNRAFTSSTEDNIEMGNLSKHAKTELSLERKRSDSDLECGFSVFRPRCLQRFATSKSYLVLYSIIGILHGSYYTYLVGVLSTLEKRFSFKSKTSGLIMILDELTPLFLGVFVGHFANRVHRPRLVSFGMFLSAFCCFASALPYFLYGTASHLTSTAVHNRTGVELCDGDPHAELCDTDDRPPTVTAIILLMLGSFLKGFGNLAYYAIGLAYLDDNAKKKNTPIYFAVAFALRLLGPMVGYIMSSAFLKYYENPLYNPGFGPEDPRWIGGWWMGFVLQGILLMIFAGPLAFFPRSLPGHKQQEPTTSSLFDVSGLMDALKRLAKNPLYILITCNTVFVIYGNFGFYIMSPKYLENQFRLTASNASLFAGPPGIAAFMISTVIGGYLIWKFRPSAKFLAGGLVCMEVISTIGYLLLMIPQCESVKMSNFGHREESLMLEGGCNRACNCTTVSFAPVCGPDGESYFSPCFAGCTSHSDQTYSNCSCIDDPIQEARRGLCVSDSCAAQALAYIVTLPALQFVVNSLRVANTMILLRSIKPEDKNIALGVFETILSTIAFIPFPIVYGALIDSTCLVWEESCGETGNCWFYDIRRFNYFMHGASALFCGLSCFNLLAIYFFVHRVGDLYEEEEEDTSPKAMEEERDVIASIKL